MTQVLLAAVVAALPLDPLIPGNPAVLKGHTDAVVSVAFSPDGKTLVSGSRDKTVKLWNLETGAVIVTIPDAKQQPIAFSFSPDGKRLAIGDSTLEVRVVELPSGKVLQSWLHPDAIAQVAFDGSGERVVVSGFNGNGAVYGAADGKKAAEVRANSIVLLSDGKEALVTTPDHHLKQVELKTGKVKKDLATEPRLGQLVATKDAALLLSWSPKDPDVLVLDRKTGKVTGTLSGPKGDASMPERRVSAEVSSASLTPDGAFLATASQDKTVRVWDVAKAAVVKSFPVQQLSTVAISPDGAWVAATDVGLIKLFKR